VNFLGCFSRRFPLAGDEGILPLPISLQPEDLPQLAVAGFNLPIEKSPLPVGKCLLSVNLSHLPVAG